MKAKMLLSLCGKWETLSLTLSTLLWTTSRIHMNVAIWLTTSWSLKERCQLDCRSIWGRGKQWSREERPVHILGGLVTTWCQLSTCHITNTGPLAIHCILVNNYSLLVKTPMYLCQFLSKPCLGICLTSFVCTSFNQTIVQKSWTKITSCCWGQSF